MADLINASLAHSYIPPCWKAAPVTIILKPMKNPNLALSYRACHEELIFKLSEIWLPCYLGAWLKNYLSGRFFQVKVNGNLSTQKLIGAVVPQGSILGPLLFNIYFISIISEVLSNKYSKIVLYADDLAIWVSSPYEKILNKQLLLDKQLILNSFLSWMRIWKMVISETKTMYYHMMVMNIP